VIAIEEDRADPETRTAPEAATLGRRERKKLQTRAALVDAALRLAAERGLDQVTVEDISQAVDVSSRTFFNYFAHKEEAIVDGHLGAAAMVHDRFLAVPADVPVIGAIRMALAPLLAEMEADREHWFLRLRVIHQNPSLLTRLITGGAEAERALVEAIAARVGAPPGHHYPALVAAVTGAAMRTAMVSWVTADGARRLADLLDEVFTDIASGLPDPS
jgi:AcrR family transcriptional regulator